MLASSLAACSKPDDSQGGAADTTVSSSPEADGKKELPKLNFEGQEYRILARDSSWAPNFEIYRDELPEDVVGKAVWERNNKLYEKYGITVAGTLSYDNNGAAKPCLSRATIFMI